MPAHPLARSARFGSVLLASALLVGCSGAAAPSGATTKSVAPGKSTPSIDTAAGIRYATATIAKLNKDPFVAHVEQLTTATQEMGGQSAKMLATMSADFAGDDMDVDLEATAIGQKINMRLRLVGKNAYVYQSGYVAEGEALRDQGRDQATSSMPCGSSRTRTTCATWARNGSASRPAALPLTASAAIRIRSRIRGPLRRLRHLGEGGRDAGPLRGHVPRSRTRRSARSPAR